MNSIASSRKYSTEAITEEAHETVADDEGAVAADEEEEEEMQQQQQQKPSKDARAQSVLEIIEQVHKLRRSKQWVVALDLIEK